VKAYLHRRYHFSASHRLHCDALDEAQNRDVYGKCNNPHGHGHNYSFQVTISGQIDPLTGMVLDLSELDATVSRDVLERFDQVNLNLDPAFAHQVPTTENLTVLLFDLLQRRFPHATLEEIKVMETSNNTFNYAGKKENLR
jgi:6-pyruvoyltetrahydropterin/6-carboxytetrahydropterin synthase